MAAPVKVYGPPLWTAVSRVLACLLEKDVEFQLVPVNMAKGEHKNPVFLTIQPFGQVHAFQDESITIFAGEQQVLGGRRVHSGRSIALAKHALLGERGESRRGLQLKEECGPVVERDLEPRHVEESCGDAKEQVRFWVWLALCKTGFCN
ncbi:Mechanosensitive ion channel protein [Psidium guajava]|nr:Mechanosensitive ion channel protein [Psidium guajava]